MNIIDKLRQKAAEVILDSSGAVGREIQDKALAAITDGVGSPAWRAYMASFTSDPAELRRLNADDSTKEVLYQKHNRAYIAANGMCGSQTDTRTFKLVDSRIDDDELPPEQPA